MANTLVNPCIAYPKDVIGDSYLHLRAAEGYDLQEGSCRLESLTGTNGIGTAMAKKEPVHVPPQRPGSHRSSSDTSYISPAADPLFTRLLWVLLLLKTNISTNLPDMFVFHPRAGRWHAL